MHISDMYITPKYISTYQNISVYIKSTDKVDKKYRQGRLSRRYPWVDDGGVRGGMHDLMEQKKGSYLESWCELVEE